MVAEGGCPSRWVKKQKIKEDQKWRRISTRRRNYPTETKEDKGQISVYKSEESTAENVRKWCLWWQRNQHC